MYLKRRSVLYLMVVFCLVSRIPPATASCGIDFDKMKCRRIEAIRGQILSKLGMAQLPRDEKPPGVVPRETVAMYNRTRDFVEEQARIRRQQCEELDVDYFAEEIVTVYTNDNATGLKEVNDYKDRKLMRQVSEFFEYDLEPLKLDSASITSATMRFFQIPNTGSTSEINQQIDLHQLTLPGKEGHSPGRYFLDMRLVNKQESGWQSFDVTTTIREWVRYPHTNLGLEMTVPCPEDDASRSPTRRSSTRGVREKLEILFAGSTAISEEGRGDRKVDYAATKAAAKDLHPQLVIMTRSRAAQEHAKGRRRAKRALDAEFCFNSNPTETNCCLRELYIDFRRDLKWDWIHAPSGYNANFCAGACPYLWSMDTQHSTILSLYKSMNPKASSSPCCVPRELDPLTIMFYNKGRFQVKRLSDMVLLSCKCS